VRRRWLVVVMMIGRYDWLESNISSYNTLEV
jgi:hypothetical protein